MQPTTSTVRCGGPVPPVISYATIGRPCTERPSRKRRTLVPGVRGAARGRLTGAVGDLGTVGTVGTVADPTTRCPPPHAATNSAASATPASIASRRQLRDNGLREVREMAAYVTHVGGRGARSSYAIQSELSGRS